MTFEQLKISHLSHSLSMQHLLSTGDSSVFSIRTFLHQFNFPTNPLLAFIFLLAFSVLAHNCNLANFGRFIGLDTSFTRILLDWKVMGFATRVPEKDRVVCAKAFGYHDLDKRCSICQTKLLAIGNCTKALLSPLIRLLLKACKSTTTSG